MQINNLFYATPFFQKFTGGLGIFKYSIILVIIPRRYEAFKIGIDVKWCIIKSNNEFDASINSCFNA